MTPLDAARSLRGRGRAGQLAARLDADPAAEPVVAHLRSAGEQLALVAAPREQFRADLRQRLLAVAAVQAAQAGTALTGTGAPAARAGVSWRSPGRAGGVAAGAMASVVAVTGVAVAGAQSLPGDPFYGVKRTTEALQLQLTDGDADRGNRHLELAATRLGEVRGLVLGRDAVAAAAPTLDGVAVQPVASTGPRAGAVLGAPVADRVEDTLGDMDEATLRGQELLDAAFRATRDDAPLLALARFATRQSEGLERLLPSLPPTAQDRARTSLALLTEVEDETEQQLDSPACGPACDPAAAAPTAPPVAPPLANPLEPTAGSTPAPCGCVPAPSPVPQPTPAPEGSPQPGSPSEPAASPSAPPGDGPTGSPSPSPSPSPTAQPLPVPLPSPLPLPSLPPLPVPLPSLPPPLPGQEPLLDPLDPLLGPLLGNALEAPGFLVGLAALLVDPRLGD